jgi:hypothetical protein
VSTGKAQRPPVGEPWVWLTRELLSSDAWRSLSINGRRFIDALLIEHMAHAGRANGQLKATHRQLYQMGIGQHHATRAICEAEELGLVDCHRGGMRVATTYTLTWLQPHDGAPASNRWRSYRNPDLASSRASKNQKSACQTAGKAACQTAGRSPKSACQTAGRLPKNPACQTAGAYKKSSYQATADNALYVVGAGRRAMASLAVASSAAPAPCSTGKPAGMGGADICCGGDPMSTGPNRARQFEFNEALMLKDSIT